MKLIKLTQGYAAIVDDEDYEYLSQWKWHTDIKADNQRYAVRSNRRNKKACRPYKVRMHRILVDAQEGQFVDHINHNGLDNRRDNIRLCTLSQNSQNARPRGGNSKYKGVKKDGGKWSASITINGKQRYIGSYQTEVGAALAYDEAAKKHFREFACLNWPGFVYLEYVI